MSNKYNVTLWFTIDGEGWVEKGTVEFRCDPEQYGNGYSMGISGLGEPFGFQAYDLRYDNDFHEDNKISYITKFFTDRKYRECVALIGIRVHEAEEE